MNATTYEPVKQSVEVPVDQGTAFDLFTRDVSSWWPLRSHSIAGEAAIDVFFDLEPGGRIYEVDSHGNEHEWGQVIECEPPNRILLSWYPGHPKSEATEVEIVFRNFGASTRVDLEHRHWDRLGENAGKLRRSYDTGWVDVLALFADSAGG